MKRICVQWPRLGPYHLARLEALHEVAARNGTQIVAIETAGSDRLYGWEAPANALPFERICLFPDTTFEDLPPGRIRKRVFQSLDTLNPDAVVINSYSFPDARACLSWCRSHRRVAIVATDSKADDAERTPWREWFKSRLIRQFDAALVAGTPHRQYLEMLDFPSDYIFLGYDVVDNDFFRSAAADIRQQGTAPRELPGLKDPTPYLLSVGRYIPTKNFSTLIKVYASYRKATRRPWRLVLVGDGPLRGAYERLIAEKGIEGVTLTGFMNQSNLAAYYSLASAYVHPALKDTWALAVNEAMASGLPVLVSAKAGCAYDLVETGQNGYRFDPRSADELETLLLRISDPAIDIAEMGHRSQEIISSWSTDFFASQVLAAFHAGRRRSDRRMDPVVSLGLRALDKFSKSVASFHSVPS